MAGLGKCFSSTINAQYRKSNEGERAHALTVRQRVQEMDSDDIPLSVYF